MGVCAGPAQSLLPSKPRPPSQRWKTSLCVRFCMRGQSLLHCIMPIRCGRLVLGRHAILDTILCMVRSCHCVAVLGPLIPPLALLHFKKKKRHAQPESRSIGCLPSGGARDLTGRAGVPPAGSVGHRSTGGPPFPHRSNRRRPTTHVVGAQPPADLVLPGVKRRLPEASSIVVYCRPASLVDKTLQSGITYRYRLLFRFPVIDD